MVDGAIDLPQEGRHEVQKNGPLNGPFFMQLSPIPWLIHNFAGVHKILRFDFCKTSWFLAPSQQIPSDILEVIVLSFRMRFFKTCCYFTTSFAICDLRCRKFSTNSSVFLPGDHDLSDWLPPAKNPVHATHRSFFFLFF